MYSVYILTVKDGRKYIGATSMKPKARWNHGNGYRHSPELWEIICRDGWESINAEVVQDGLTDGEASLLEQELIGRYHTVEPKCGFNVEHGGVNSHKIISDSTRAKMREKQTGVQNNNYGKHFSEEHKRKLAESNRGQKRSEETCRKNGEAHSKAVSQYSMSGEFLATYESGRTAERITGIPAYAISKACRGVHSQAGGYLWKFTNQ